MLLNLTYVALGGALGAVLRYLTGLGVLRLFGAGFPLGVISVNIVGSFLMGLFVVLAERKGLVHLSPFVMTGLLGGFTTFSAFSLEAVSLFEKGDTVGAAFYVVLSVVASIAALCLGVWLARGIWA
ncbi:fluoride efflux transporter CrcB [Cognatishimia sp.]|uniref:fluoride efflux transporter CrcB n=1 Tax=Cognatishimia sp. TaxID=2211648 RepID=UPI003513BEEA